MGDCALNSVSVALLLRRAVQGTHGEKVSHIALERLDPTQVLVFTFKRIESKGVVTEYDGATVYGACRGKRSADVFATDPCITNEGVDATGLRVFFPCRDEDTCMEAAADFAGIASFAVTSDFAGWKAKQAAQEAKKEEKNNKAPPTPAEPTRVSAVSINTLNAATAGAEILLAAAEPRVLRVMQGMDAAIDDAGQLIIRRRACLALISAEFGKGNECRADALYRDYDLVIDTGALDPDSIRVRSATASAGERGVWISAACKRVIACAVLRVTGAADTSEK